MATRIAGIQPAYLPCLGYFGPMLHADFFLLANDESSSGSAP